jgi:thioredoxin type arsenate reductase
MTDPTRLRVLFLCTENSCRSPMAEGLARLLGKGFVDASSAGTSLVPVHPLAVRVMAEVGIDISTHQPQHVDRVLNQKFDVVITVCDRIKEDCPTWPDAAEHTHWSFLDPAQAGRTEEERVAAFRRVRDEISRRVQMFLLAHHVLDGSGRDPIA